MDSSSESTHPDGRANSAAMAGSESTLGRVAPLHRHSREDEYSFVLEGRIGAVLGEKVVYAEADELAFRPRGERHTFWNPDDTPCRVLEIISPGGFEHFFDELASALQASATRAPDVAQIEARYGIEFQVHSVPRLCAEHQLDHPLLHMSAGQ